MKAARIPRPFHRWTQSLVRWFAAVAAAWAVFARADCIDGREEARPSILPALHAQSRVRSPAQKTTVVVNGILFDSDYDNGSILDVVSGGSWDVFDCTLFTESGEFGTRKYWFRFTMTGTASRAIMLNIDHSVNPRPVVRIDDAPWRRATATEAPDSDRLVFAFGPGEDTAEVALFFPLGVTETYAAASDLIASSPHAAVEVIGQSYQGRDMWMVTVTDPACADAGKHRIWVHSRAHAGEVTSTHTILGILEQATENSALGRLLRARCIFNLVPLQNVDGVYLGHTRWDSQGKDPERQWCDVEIPEAANIKAQVDTFMAGPVPIEVALNLHSTQGAYTDTFFFKHLSPSVTEAFEEIQQDYIDAFDNATPLFDNLSPGSSQLHSCYFIESYFWNNWGESVMALTHEGHFYRRITDNAWITDADYRELGRALAAALVEYLALEPLPAIDGLQLH